MPPPLGQWDLRIVLQQIGLKIFTIGNFFQDNFIQRS